MINDFEQSGVGNLLSGLTQGSKDVVIVEIAPHKQVETRTEPRENDIVPPGEKTDRICLVTSQFIRGRLAMFMGPQELKRQDSAIESIITAAARSVVLALAKKNKDLDIPSKTIFQEVDTVANEVVTSFLQSNQNSSLEGAA